MYRKRLAPVLMASAAAAVSGLALAAEHATSTKNVPTLSETLQWLRGASRAEFAGDIAHIDFDSDPSNNCSATITETRIKAGPNFWIKMSFSLADIDPADIQVFNLEKEISTVRFHTTNYAEKIINTSSNFPEPTRVSEYTVYTNDWFAPKFARAFKHAVELCGGKRSSF